MTFSPIVIPINFPMRQTIPVLADDDPGPVYAEVDFISNEEFPRVIPPTDYHSNPAYMHFTNY